MNADTLAEERLVLGRLGITLAVFCLVPWAIGFSSAGGNPQLAFSWQLAEDVPGIWWFVGALGAGGVAMRVFVAMRDRIDDRRVILIGAVWSLLGLASFYLALLSALDASAQRAGPTLDALDLAMSPLGLGVLILVIAAARLRLDRPHTRIGRALLGASAITLLLAAFLPRDLPSLGSSGDGAVVEGAATAAQSPWLHTLELVGLMFERGGQLGGVFFFVVLMLLWLLTPPLAALLSLFGLKQPDEGELRAHDHAREGPSKQAAAGESDDEVETPSRQVRTAQDDAWSEDRPPLSVEAVRWWATFYLPIAVLIFGGVMMGAHVLFVMSLVLAVALGTWIATAARGLELLLLRLEPEPPTTATPAPTPESDSLPARTPDEPKSDILRE